MPKEEKPDKSCTGIKNVAASSSQTTSPSLTHVDASAFPPPNSLFDDDDSTAAFTVELQTFKSDGDLDITNTDKGVLTRATAGYLEMEEEPPREVNINDRIDFKNRNNKTSDDSIPVNAMVDEPIKTDSGLVLTHRKNPAIPVHRSHHHEHIHTVHRNYPHNFPQNYVGDKALFGNARPDYFEVENGVVRGWDKESPSFRGRREGVNYFESSGVDGGSNKHSMVMLQAKRLRSYVKIWIVLFSLLLLVMTGVFFHSFWHTGNEDPETTTTKTATSSAFKIDVTIDTTTANGGSSSSLQSPTILLPDATPDKILLLPLEDISQLSSSGQRISHNRHLHQR